VEQKDNKEEEKVLGEMERVYNRRRYLGE